MKELTLILLLITAISLTSCLTDNNKGEGGPAITGDYLGQASPGDTAALFAPGIISTGMNERDFAVSPDGNEIFFCREAGNYKYTTIFYTKRKNNTWAAPEVFEYCTDPDFKYIEPHLSPDGTKLFFVSTMPSDTASAGSEDIWISEKADGRWLKPFNPGQPLNTTGKEYFPSVTSDGTIYFTHLDTAVNDEFIYRSRFVNGLYQQPEKLGPEVNTGRARFNALIAPDESYIIIPVFGMPDSYGATDYYISFRDSLDNWSSPVNMGPEVNSGNAFEWSASVSTDGRYLFFMSARPGNNRLETLSRQSMQEFHNLPQNGNSDIYWISASVIEELKPKESSH